MPWFQDRWEALTPRVQTVLQVTVGILLAAGSFFFLMRSGGEESSFYSLFIAFGLVILVPRILETQTGNKLPMMRKVMLIGLVASIIVYAVIAIQSGSFFQ